MGGGDLATTMDVITGLDVAEEKEFHPMYEEKKGRPPDAPKWDEATERGHSELIRVGAAIDVDGRTVTRLPTSIIQQFQHNINKTTDLGHCTWPPGLQRNCSITEKTIILPQIANYFEGELDPVCTTENSPSNYDNHRVSCKTSSNFLRSIQRMGRDFLDQSKEAREGCDAFRDHKI